MGFVSIFSFRAYFRVREHLSQEAYIKQQSNVATLRDASTAAAVSTRPIPRTLTQWIVHTHRSSLAFVVMTRIITRACVLNNVEESSQF